MAPPLASSLFKLGADILATFIDKTTNVILAQLGDVLADQATSQEAEWWQHVGFASRPAKAVTGTSAAQALAITRSDRDAVIASRDGRTAQQYGTLADGETAVFSSTGQGRTLYKADGSVTHFTSSDNTTGGTSVAERLAPSGWMLTTPFGGANLDANGWTLYESAGGAFISMHNGVVTISAKTINVMGGQVQVGATASAATPALVGPAPVIGGASGVATPSKSVFISP